MGIDQKLLRGALFVTLCVCLLFLSSNMSRLLGVSSAQICDGQLKSRLVELSLWEEQSLDVYRMEQFNFNGYLSLKEYLNKVVDKRIMLFEILNGRARVVFEQA
ncbi:MAG: hypothetical protein WCH76_03745 [Candidatus Riflemargulisbacteria bacterium]